MDISKAQVPVTGGAGVPLEIARREYRLFKCGLLLAIVLGCAISLSLNLVDPDLWGHIRYAQDWIAEGELPRTASHTFTAVDHPWVNHENLAELAMAYGYHYLGTHGLLVAKCLWGLGILMLMVVIARCHKVHSFVVWPLMLLVAKNLQGFFPVRPQLLSFGLCALMLVLLDRGFSRWQEQCQVRWRWLWLLPVVFAVWVNSHGGFVAGLCIAGTYLGGKMVELCWLKRGEARSPVLLLAAVGVSCLLATLATPYGLDLHRWLLMSLGQPRPEITEWAAPKMTDPIFWPWIALMGVALVSLLGAQRKRDYVQIGILMLVAWQSVMHLRHIAFLALLCGFWLPAHVQSALRRLRPDSGTSLPVIRLAPWLRRLAVVGLLAAIFFQSLTLDGRLSNFPVRRNFYPVDAIQYMADRELSGKLVVSFNWAQYAIAALAPDVQVAFDGRFRTCYPQEVVDMHFDFLLGEFGGKRSRSPSSGPIDNSRVLEHKDPDLVLLDRRYETPVNVMQTEAKRENPKWTLLFRDRVAEIWGRSDCYDDPTHAKYMPVAARVQDASPRDGALQWPALPWRHKSSQFAGTDTSSDRG